MRPRKRIPVILMLLLAVLAMVAMPADAQTAGKKPNIVIIWGDDVGWYNISAYNLGSMGYKTPILTVLPKKEHYSRTGMARTVVPLVVPHSSQASRPSEQAS